MWRKSLFILRLIIYYQLLCWGFNRFQGRNLLRPLVDPDAWLHPVEYAEKFGYKAEEHLITTDDGVILEAHRINSKTATTATGVPVVLQHGLFNSGLAWMTNAPNQSLAFILADAGYDVWLANSRGNLYGSQNSSSPGFWNFTKDHLALHDAPSTIDYVLQKTGKPYVHYVGHSQGGFILFALLSEKPEYGEKIRLGVGLAPVLKISDASSIVKNTHRTLEILRFFGPMQLFGQSKFPTNIVVNPVVCTLFPKFCFHLFNMFAGIHETQLNLTRMGVYSDFVLSGSSFTNFQHYTQTIDSDKFSKYDYGPERNIQIYGQKQAPEYDLSKITGNVAVFYSEADLDVYAGKRHNQWMVNNIPKSSLVLAEVVPEFHHLDFVSGINARKPIYDRIVQLFNRYDD